MPGKKSGEMNSSPATCHSATYNVTDDIILHFIKILYPETNSLQILYKHCGIFVQR